MRTAIPILALAVAVAGCGDSGTEPSTRLAAEDLEGTWSLMLDDGEDRCSPDYAEPLSLYLFTQTDLTELESGGVNVVGRWSRTLDREFDWTATGNMNVRTGAVELHFWWTGGINGPQIRLNGTLDDREAWITGSWSETDGSIHYSGGCSGSLEAALVAR